MNGPAKIEYATAKADADYIQWRIADGYSVADSVKGYGSSLSSDPIIGPALAQIEAAEWAIKKRLEEYRDG